MDIITEFKDKGAWGLSTHIDLHECDHEKICDVNYIRDFIHDICVYIDMKPYGEPFIDRFGTQPHLEGISFSQMIETSCITGHFAEDENCAYIDIFSCKEYDPELATDFCQDYFDASDVNFIYMFRK